MKNLFSTLIILILILSCKKDGDNPPSPYSPSTYSIEGKWIYDLNAISNTMYIFKDGFKYTYYCVSGNCDSLFQSYYAGDTNALPSVHEYNFENDTLIINYNFGNIQVLPINFECDGNRINFNDPNYPDRNDWIKLGALCED